MLLFFIIFGLAFIISSLVMLMHTDVYVDVFGFILRYIPFFVFPTITLSVLNKKIIKSKKGNIYDKVYLLMIICASSLVPGIAVLGYKNCAYFPVFVIFYYFGVRLFRIFEAFHWVSYIHQCGILKAIIIYFEVYIFLFVLMVFFFFEKVHKLNYG